MLTDSLLTVCWDADTEEPLPEEGDCPAGGGPGGEEEEVGLLLCDAVNKKSNTSMKMKACVLLAFFLNSL